MTIVPEPESVKKPDAEHTILLAVTLTAPEGYADADLNDVVAFHLGTNDLNDVEADVSSVTVTGSRLLTMAPGLYLICSLCKQISVAAEVHFGPDGVLNCGRHG